MFTNLGIVFTGVLPHGVTKCSARVARNFHMFFPGLGVDQFHMGGFHSHGYIPIAGWFISWNTVWKLMISGVPMGFPIFRNPHLQPSFGENSSFCVNDRYVAQSPLPTSAPAESFQQVQDRFWGQGSQKFGKHRNHDGDISVINDVIFGPKIPRAMGCAKMSNLILQEISHRILLRTLLSEARIGRCFVTGLHWPAYKPDNCRNRRRTRSPWARSCKGLGLMSQFNISQLWGLFFISNRYGCFGDVNAEKGTSIPSPVSTKPVRVTFAASASPAGACGSHSRDVAAAHARGSADWGNHMWAAEIVYGFPYMGVPPKMVGL